MKTRTVGGPSEGVAVAEEASIGRRDESHRAKMRGDCIMPG